LKLCSIDLICSPYEMTNISLYDKIGRNYPTHRQADPRLTASILELLSLPEASEIADVGAGTGNYSLALATG
jgi:protein-L-isoaspartate O-methyltransferase